MIIRKCFPKDLDTILDIYNDAILNSTAVYEYEEFSKEYIQTWFNEKQKAGYPVLVAELDGNVAGFSTYGLFRNRCANRSTMEHSVYTHVDFRKKGVGKTLLRAIQDEAKTHKIHLLVGVIDSSNEMSIAMHAKEGFEIAGKIPEVGYKFNRWLDLVFMYKILNTNTM